MKSVACIVVTYNRLNLLKKCIESIRNQSYREYDIYIINNGSTDGTADWVSSQSDLSLITQENVGGAGGFYTGMKVAFNKGYEWVWMMDDDGIADSCQLENLLYSAGECQSKFINALVCNIASPEQLAFGLSFNGDWVTTVEEAQTVKYIPQSINPFNGTLIHRDVIASIGLIKKEMFIWGDEKEYMYRARTAGFKQYTITNALHFHPAIKSQQIKVFPLISNLTVDIPANKSRAYIKYRNNGYLCHTYYPSKEIREKMKYFIYFFLRLKFGEMYNFYKYYNRGKNNIFEPISHLK